MCLDFIDWEVRQRAIAVGDPPQSSTSTDSDRECSSMIISLPYATGRGSVPEVVCQMRTGVLCRSRRFSLLDMCAFYATFFLSSSNLEYLQTTYLCGFLPPVVGAILVDAPATIEGGRLGGRLLIAPPLVLYPLHPLVERINRRDILQENRFFYSLTKVCYICVGYSSNRF